MVYDNLPHQLFPATQAKLHILSSPTDPSYTPLLQPSPVTLTILYCTAILNEPGETPLPQLNPVTLALTSSPLQLEVYSL